MTLTRGIGRRGDKDVILVDRDGNVVKNPNIAKKSKAATEPDELDIATQARSDVKAAPAPERLGTEKSLGRKRQR